MKEGSSLQAGPEWPVNTRRAWKRRESKVVYHNTPGYSTRRIPSPASSPRESTQHSERYHPPAIQNADLGYIDNYYTVQKQGAGNQDSNFHNVVHQPGRSSIENSFFSSISYTLAPNPPNSPHIMFDGNDLQSPISGQPQMYEQDFTWNGASSGNTNLNSAVEDLQMSEFHYGSFGSLDSSMGLSTPDTASSSIHSEDFVFPIVDQTFGPSGTTDPMAGLAIPDEWYKINQAYNSSSPGAVNPGSPQYLEDLPLDNDLFRLPEWNNYYTEDSMQWPSPSETLVPQQATSPQMGEPITLTINPPNNPWNSQEQVSSISFNPTPGVVTFQQPPGPNYTTHVKRQEFLDTGQPVDRCLAPEAVTPSAESENGSWALVPSYANSYAASQGSPHSHGSPASHAPSPSQDETEHQHIFSSRPDAPKVKLPRGRQRGLTELEKRQARDVREAKACWACHISKTKCSPCSPGKPCEQCARLAGKRRFCLFSCFNDPLETLTVLLVPKYLNGHFTKANVEKFVTNNATGWGKQLMPVRLSWGYDDPIGVEVVTMELRPNSEMGFYHQAEATNALITRPILVRKNSPPLGIPLADVDELQDEYLQYVRNIVENNVMGYMFCGYVDQQSDLPEKLLGAICSYYKATREQDNESDLLRQAIEMHVTAVILERSLTLDDESQSQVQQQLQEVYPEGSAPRCAQRQIKLAFYFLQEKKIKKVLTDWGSMMWSTSNNISKDNEWATAFSVFLMMILVTDKILGAAWYFCEGNIKHRQHDPISERRQFQKLVELTEKELFERCKEIFHWKFKTRKGGKEACNPIRDGVEAFQSKSKSAPVDGSVRALVWELQSIVGDYEKEVRSHRTDADSESLYTDAGRLACIFLDDFLGR